STGRIWPDVLVICTALLLVVSPALVPAPSDGGDRRFLVEQALTAPSDRRSRVAGPLADGCQRLACEELPRPRHTHTRAEVDTQRAEASRVDPDGSTGFNVNRLVGTGK